MGAEFLVQGTIAPDWIESEGNIKSHHNVALPTDWFWKLWSQARELYKDEVRILGSELGLPEHITQRQPYPGRIGSADCRGYNSEKISICRQANAIVEEEVHKEGLEKLYGSTLRFDQHQSYWC